MKIVLEYGLIVVAWLIELISRLLLPVLAITGVAGILWLWAWAIMELWRTL